MSAGDHNGGGQGGTFPILFFRVRSAPEYISAKVVPGNVRDDSAAGGLPDPVRLTGKRAATATPNGTRVVPPLVVYDRAPSLDEKLPARVNVRPI